VDAAEKFSVVSLQSSMHGNQGKKAAGYAGPLTLVASAGNWRLLLLLRHLWRLRLRSLLHLRIGLGCRWLSVRIFALRLRLILIAWTARRHSLRRSHVANRLAGNHHLHASILLTSAGT
jgi:hypothetical protein